MEPENRWYCVRQRAGALVKECRSIRPRLSANDTPWERTEKNRILRPPRERLIDSRIKSAAL